MECVMMASPEDDLCGPLKLWWCRSFPSFGDFVFLCAPTTPAIQKERSQFWSHILHGSSRATVCVQITGLSGAEDPEVKRPLKVCRVLRLLILALPNSMPAPAPLATMTAVMQVLVWSTTVPQPPHHLMVLVAQQARQEERGFVSATSFKASPWPPFTIDGNIPQLFGAGPPFAAPSWWLRQLCGVVARCIGVVSQLKDALHKFTLLVKHFLRTWRGKKRTF